MGLMSDMDDPITKICLRMSKAVDGENLMDVATAATAMIAFCLKQSYKTKQEQFEVLDELAKFMIEQLNHHGRRKNK